MFNRIVCTLAVVCLAAGPGWASLSYSFTAITANGVGSPGIGEAQLSMQVSSVVGQSDQALFSFSNTGLLSCSITHVYFDDGTLLGIADVINGSGVRFSEGARPNNLPGGSAIGFQVTKGFSADADAPIQWNGVQPGETLGILFDLKEGMTYEDVVSALALGVAQGGVEGSLRVGLHVQAFDNGASESFVNKGLTTVPAPAAVTLGAIGLAFAGLLRRRFRST